MSTNTTWPISGEHPWEGMPVIVIGRLSKKALEKDKYGHVLPGQSGLEIQDKNGRRFAEQNKMRVVASVGDFASGRKVSPFERKNTRPWLTDPELMGQYVGIIADKNDRLSRAKWTDEARIRIWADEQGKQIFIVQHGLHWPPTGGNDSFEAIKWQFYAGQAAQEWDDISSRWTEHHKERRADPEGTVISGYADYGYDQVPNGKGHVTKVINAGQQKIMQEIAQKVIDGRSQRSLCQEYGWPKSTMAQRLRNPAMRGYQINETRFYAVTKDGKHVVVDKDDNTPGLIKLRAYYNLKDRPVVRDNYGNPIQRFPEVIPEQMWNDLQAALDKQAGPSRVFGYKTHLLTGILFCQHHGNPMTLGPVGTREPMRLVDGKRVQGTQKPRDQWKIYYGTDCVLCPCQKVPQAEIEQYVNDWFTGPAGQSLDETKISVTPGNDHGLANVAAMIDKLDIRSADFLTERERLLAEETRIKTTTTPDPPGIRRVSTGRKVSDIWRAMTDREKHDFMLKHDVRVTAQIVTVKKPCRKCGELTSGRWGLCKEHYGLKGPRLDKPRNNRRAMFHIDPGDLKPSERSEVAA